MEAAVIELCVHMTFMHTLLVVSLEEFEGIYFFTELQSYGGLIFQYYGKGRPMACCCYSSNWLQLDIGDNMNTNNNNTRAAAGLQITLRMKLLLPSCTYNLHLVLYKYH